MAPLRRKRPQDEAPAASAPAPEATTRRATRQTSIAPLPIQPDPEPRKRRRRADANEEEEVAEPSRPLKTQRAPAGLRGKENIPAMHTTKLEPLKQVRQPARHGGALTTTTTSTSAVKTNGLNSTPSSHSTARQGTLQFHTPYTQPRRPSGMKQPQTIQPHHHTVGTTKPITIATSGPQSQRKAAPHRGHPSSSASPQNPRGAKPSSDRNIDKVVLGDICFRAWYPSYYGKEVLGDSSTSHHPQPHENAHQTDSKDVTGAKGHTRHRDPPPILNRLCVCPCCFKYSKELVTWWEHVRICEARGHIPGRKIYTHPKGSRTTLVPAPGSAVPKTAKGGKRGSVTAKMVEEVVHDQGEWSIWEVDGEKDVLFCQNLSLFAKLFLDNKSVFFDVTGFNYFLLVYTPPPTTPSSASPSAPAPDPVVSSPEGLSRPRQHIVGFFSKEKMSWDNNNLACILIFPPWQRKGLGALLMGISYEISRREGVMGGPEKPISDLGKKGYKRFWGGEIARWILSLEVRDGEETVVDVEACSQGTWIAVEDCLVVLREMGVVEDAGMGVDPRKVRDVAEGEEEVVVEEVKEVHRVKVEKEAVRKWVAANGISLERTCDPGGFVEGYAMKLEDEEDET
ncbi:hypothetical protein BR93DRAFT_931245 [Coniochaeta sp. PMI_546]|nr:hypothetical protein BR93DRAFT_931245 [Coniochaeta sp. PMI_546]